MQKTTTFILFMLIIFTACSLESRPELNRLQNAVSPYLKSAASQPVNWYEWTDEAFAAAAKLDKPILLDIGAIWCHWCHVMDEETYNNKEIAALINEHFIAIKVDRDAHPDIDIQYQEMVRILGGSSGWPLTAFLLPDGRVIFGGTYFPPESRNGQPGMREILLEVARAYDEDKQKLIENADQLIKYISDSHAGNSESPSDSEVRKVEIDIQTSYDAQHGGFGSAPKFPHASALQFLLSSFKDDFNYEIIESTLRSMANGGIYDQIGGGFHRYSADNSWSVPHFEKILGVNAELLKIYAEFSKISTDPLFTQITTDLASFLFAEMRDNETGLFYSSQDADNGHGDDGSYFTWSLTQLSEVLTTVEYNFAVKYFDVKETPGNIADAPDQNVLRRAVSAENYSDIFDKSKEEIQKEAEQIREKLLKARSQRRTPSIDRTFYTDANAMMISSLASLYKVSGDRQIRVYAVRAIDFILQNVYSPTEGFAHLYSNNRPSGYGLFEDQARILEALIDIFGITGNIRYFSIAEEITSLIIKDYEDKNNGGFFNQLTSERKTPLNLPVKIYEDSPYASQNAVMIRSLDRLYLLTGNKHYKDVSERALRGFTHRNKVNSLFRAAFTHALSKHLKPSMEIIIIGRMENKIVESMINSARSLIMPDTDIFVFSPDIDFSFLPENVTSKLTAIPSGMTAAFVCNDKFCTAPAYNAVELLQRIKSF